jgi:hypothetical protein
MLKTITIMLISLLGLAAATVGTGTITGELGYPGEYVPALYIVAFTLDAGETRIFTTTDGQQSFALTCMKPGNYAVVAYLATDTTIAGGYTAFALTDLSTSYDDHTLLQVPVVAGKTTTGVQLRDWYAPDGTFPPFPGIK